MVMVGSFNKNDLFMNFLFHVKTEKTWTVSSLKNASEHKEKQRNIRKRQENKYQVLFTLKRSKTVAIQPAFILTVESFK